MRFFNWLLRERCLRCGVSYNKADRVCYDGNVIVVSGMGRSRDPHYWPHSEDKFPPYTEEQWEQLVEWVTGPDD